jgi:hypothetical protein
MVDLKDFEKHCECVYKEERYFVRDNGSVLRHPHDITRYRPTDNKWTFGKLNPKTGYLEIASVVIHRIVATAFQGEPPTKEYVVDHIDTNKQNNRPDNLRWVTRLENVLLNPITVKRIEVACGCSIEEFLAEPSKFRNKFQEPNYEWMCTVSIQEAQTSKERLLAWAKSDKRLSGGSLSEWIYNRGLPKTDIEDIPDFTNCLTLNAKQKNWKTPSKFPCCPQDVSNNPIRTYLANLRAEKIFSQNQYSNSIIEGFAISKDENKLWIMSRSSDNNAIKPYSLAEVTYENDFFVHNSLGSFFKKDGVEKQFTLVQGLEWTGGEIFDDYA